MSLSLLPIEKFCDALAGVKDIYLVDPYLMTESFANGNAAPSNVYYNIRYRNDTGQYAEESANGDGGTYATLSLDFFIPGRRAAVRHMIIHCANRFVSCVAYNRYGQKILLRNAIFGYKYSSGKKLGENEGYSISLKSTDLLKSAYYIQEEDEDFTGLVGVIPGVNVINTTTPTLTSGNPTSSDCCVRIIPALVPNAPAATGNTNFNEIVTTTSGEIYFIDKTGRSIKLSSTTSRHIINDASTTPYTLPFTAGSHEKLMVYRNGVKLEHVASPTTYNQYFLNSSNQIVLPPEWPLTTGEYIEVIRI